MEPYVIFFLVFGVMLIFTGVYFLISKYPRLARGDYGKPYPIQYYRYVGMTIIFLGLSVIISSLVLQFINVIVFIIVFIITIVLSFVLARKLFYKEEYDKR